MLTFSKQTDPFTGEYYVQAPFKGLFLTEHPVYNKGTAFPEDERHSLGLCGLLPEGVSSLKQQKERTYEAFSSKSSDLEKYIYMLSLQDRNETLYYALLLDHLEEMLPIVYTPTVGKACQQFSHLYRRRRGLYISARNIDHIDEIFSNAPFSNVSLIVVTDGERILGLGDLGMGGMGIPIGKISLYVAAAGIHPAYTLPILVDVGTNNEALLEDPLYLGLRQKRLEGDEYDEVIEAVLNGVRRHFPTALFQWEDFGRNNAFRLLERYRERICSFNDDIQGTGAVALAVLLSAMRIKKEKLRDQRIVIFGQGQAGLGIAMQVITALQDEGLSYEQACSRIYGIDVDGLLVEGMSVREEQKLLLKKRSEVADWKLDNPDKITLLDTIRNCKATILFGVTGQSGSFDESILKQMSENCKLPLIMPISNPTHKAECTPEFAIQTTEGNCLIATGSPFAPVQYKGEERKISQCNNLYIFPGVGLGALVAGTPKVTDEMFLASAIALSKMVSQDQLDQGLMLPPIDEIRQVSAKVAHAVTLEARQSGLGVRAGDDKLFDMVKNAMWKPVYLSYRHAKS
ncbi:oxaloacetate-decarboxylating malate dehydrogenase [candidate division KSB1 bacterium]|nr:oxaloacetate-decarboxylating malate dehydrogenase [candidate division KSB1 bacterium]